MESNPDLSKCANPGCEATFLRLSEGTLTVLSVEEPAGLGLPPHIRQKVVWLCDRCARHKYIRYDRERHHIAVLEIPPPPRPRAA